VHLLRETFENLKTAIRSWGKYVPWPVVQLLYTSGESVLEVRELEVTMFFSDIQDFTSKVENMHPESALMLLSRYFRDMSKVVDDRRGVVIEFIGDAILAIYGEPLVNPNHAYFGVCGALEMISALERINRWLVGKQLPEVNIRCGLHTGKVLVGNMGGKSRRKYGIIGEDADFPGYLEEMNKLFGTTILITQNTYNHLQRGSRLTSLTIRPVDYVRLRKDPAAPMELIYEVIVCQNSTRRGIRKAVEMHSKAMQFYVAEDYEEAAQKFARVRDMMAEALGESAPPDGPSTVLLKRCLEHLGPEGSDRRVELI